MVTLCKEDYEDFKDISENIVKIWKQENPFKKEEFRPARLCPLWVKYLMPPDVLQVEGSLNWDETKLNIHCPKTFPHDEQAAAQLVLGILVHEYTHYLQHLGGEADEPICRSKKMQAEWVKDVNSLVPQHHWDNYYNCPIEQEAHAAQIAAELIYLGCTDWADAQKYLDSAEGYKRPKDRLKGDSVLFPAWDNIVLGFAKDKFGQLQTPKSGGTKKAQNVPASN